MSYLLKRKIIKQSSFKCQVYLIVPLSKKILLWGAPFIAKLQTELSNNELWWKISNNGLLH